MREQEAEQWLGGEKVSRHHISIPISIEVETPAPAQAIVDLQPHANTDTEISITQITGRPAPISKHTAFQCTLDTIQFLSSTGGSIEHTRRLIED